MDCVRPLELRNASSRIERFLYCEGGEHTIDGALIYAFGLDNLKLLFMTI